MNGIRRPTLQGRSRILLAFCPGALALGGCGQDEDSGRSAVAQAFEESVKRAREAQLERGDIMVSNGTVARVDVTTPAVSSLSGIRAGDPEDAVAAAYGDHLVAEPLYDHDGAIYTYIPDDPSDNTRLVITVLEGSVFSIRAGRLPEVEYVEGCV